ncbi:MAG: MBL fold metallo-hydrolase [Methanothrix sp.]|jgi:glyoxylase-like metal-dependent hydrolase (beta-lactamase superfamily II)|nr:MBL fold metallo-hydrolase [Methanothrix sp.]OPX82388.1 MAG: hydroxyacylglutathione hydrolase [Methanosaeta sp. PtaB.Bin087]NLX39345.1 MBL fold metallo-hydrolase [Methanothrix sp.]HNR57231.1 MBL fold metallo-hydrolase [Methanothrix sp.]HNT71806.1 MBL fold metallo-hydrolase [Methanothrix sp.]
MVEVHKVNGGGPTHEGNVYLIIDEVAALIDAGRNAEATKRNVEKLIDPGKIKFIVLTHCHHDHTAGVPVLKAATGAKVLIGEGEVCDLGDDVATGSYQYGEDPAEFGIDGTLEEGDVINLGEWSLSVMKTPGHSPGSISLYEPRARVLFSGDTLLPHGNIGRTRRSGEMVKELVRSVERLAALDVLVLYPGHMEPTDENVGEQLRTSLEFARSIH